jgi:hypothetical protein
MTPKVTPLHLAAALFLLREVHPPVQDLLPFRELRDALLLLSEGSAWEKPLGETAARRFSELVDQVESRLPPIPGPGPIPFSPCGDARSPS